MTTNHITLFILGTSLIALSACSPRETTQYMPKGYRYQDNTPLSSPAPSSPWKAERVITNPEVISSNIAAWQGAAYELIEGLQQYFPQDGTPIGFATWKKDPTAQNNALDHYLRQAMMQKGLPMNTKDNTGYVLVYDASPLTDSSTLKLAQKITNYQVVKGASLKGLYLLNATFISPTGESLGSSAITAVLPDEQ